MPDADDNGIERQISQWRTFLRNRRAIHEADVDELESHLRDRMDELAAAGLDAEEAFLVAVKRMGGVDALSREFAREHSERLWKQLVLAPESGGDAGKTAKTEIAAVLGLAAAAALTFKLPGWFGFEFEGAGAGFYARNFSLFVLPYLAVFFVWKRRPAAGLVKWLAFLFAAAALFANAYPFEPAGATEVLTAIHVPIALWLAAGAAHAGGRWNTVEGRMDFVRFSGEWFIYYSLVALGGGVLTGITLAMFSFIGLNIEFLAETWILPCGALGAVIVCAWLVEAKKSVVENMAPVLTWIFTPLFTLMLLAFLATMAWTGSGINVDREVLIGFDLLLVLVLGLLLYALSARDPKARPGWFDVTQLVLVVCALIVDALALSAIAWRISEWGFSANKTAALGENLILLVNLAWSAWLYLRFIRGRGPFGGLERWQTACLPVYAVWAWIVVIVFPPLFGFV